MGPDNHAHTHHGADSSKPEWACSQGIADIDGDERAERTEHKHSHGHGDEYKCQAAMSKDEFVAGTKIVGQRFQRLLARRGRRTDDGQSGQHAGRENEAGAIQIEAGFFGQPSNQHSSQGRRSKPDHIEGLSHQGIGSQQPLGRHQGAQGNRLRGSKKAGDHTQGHKDSGDLRNVCYKQQQHHQAGANQVTGDHYPLDVPAVHKDPRRRPDQSQRQSVCDNHQRDLDWISVPGIGNQADDGEQGQEIAKDAYELRQPQRAERFLPQNIFQGKGRCGGRHAPR